MSRFESDPTPDELAALEREASAVLTQLRSSQFEGRWPVCFEFAGSPKAGKSTIIGIVSLFLHRSGFRVSRPPEGASLETPPDLKDDLLAFNVWCGCYAVQNLLIRSHEGDPFDILILDRGLFDAAVWLEYLFEDGIIKQATRDAVTNFVLDVAWCERESVVYMLLADSQTALVRERWSQLTTRPGRAMNADFLGKVTSTYDKVSRRETSRLPRIVTLDTSAVEGRLPSLQRVAFEVAKDMLQTIRTASEQELLVVQPLTQAGFVDDPAILDRVCNEVYRHPRFMLRTEAEDTAACQQVVPYGALKQDGKWLCARRRTVGERESLRGKRTMLFGGHAERKDFEAGPPEDVLRRCIERELAEELIGVAVQSVQLRGLINDTENEMGTKHLAFLHVVEVRGKGAARRQTSDREFAREPLTWMSAKEIEGLISEFDPWSQLVAAKLLGVRVPEDLQGHLFRLFI